MNIISWVIIFCLIIIVFSVIIIFDIVRFFILGFIKKVIRFIRTISRCPYKNKYSILKIIFRIYKYDYSIVRVIYRKIVDNIRVIIIVLLLLVLVSLK